MVRKGYSAPTYTQAPNAFFDDHMKDMGEAELKVVAFVIRQTFGYHRESHPISLTDFQDGTNLTRQAVVDGIKAAMERGVLDRAPSGNSFAYFLVVNEIDQEESTQETPASQPNRPEVVKEVDQSEHPLKKDSKERSKEQKTRPRDLLFDAIVEVCILDPKIDGSYIGKTKKALLKMEKTPQDVLDFGLWWYANDWRGKQGQAPSQYNLVTEIAKAQIVKSHPDKGPEEDAELAARLHAFFEQKRRQKEQAHADH